MLADLTLAQRGEIERRAAQIRVFEGELAATTQKAASLHEQIETARFTLEDLLEQASDLERRVRLQQEKARQLRAR